MQCPNIKSTGPTYTSNESINKMQKAIALVILEDTKDSLKNSSFFSVMIDESTDLSVSKKLIVYVKIINNKGQAEVHFVRNVDVPN